MPYENEHSCRMRSPDDFEPKSFRRKKDGLLAKILGKLKGEDDMTLQAYRYPTKDWTESKARSHCKKEGGEFHAAKKEDAAGDVRNCFIEFRDAAGPMGYEERWVEGYATTGITDWYGEIITPEATERAVEEWARWRNVRLMHTANPVGTVEEIKMTDDGLYIGARIVDDEAWTKVKGGALKGFSIGFWPTKYEYDKELDVGVITDYRLVEVSLVDYPANPDCAFTLFKRAGDDAMPETPESQDDIKTIGQRVSDIWSKIFKGGETMEPDLKAELDVEKAKAVAAETKAAELQAELDKIEQAKAAELDAEAEAFTLNLETEGKVEPARHAEIKERYIKDPEWAKEWAAGLGDKLNPEGAKGAKATDGRPPKRSKALDASMPVTGPTDPDERAALAEEAKAIQFREKITLAEAQDKALAKWLEENS